MRAGGVGSTSKTVIHSSMSNRIDDLIESAFQSDAPLVVSLHSGQRIRARRVKGRKEGTSGSFVTLEIRRRELVMVALSEIADVRMERSE